MRANSPAAVVTVLCPEIGHQVIGDRIGLAAISMQSPQRVAGGVGDDVALELVDGRGGTE